MRKNIGNDKVVRAITIGIATMLAATSMPLNVLAEEISETVNEEETGEEGAKKDSEETTDEGEDSGVVADEDASSEEKAPSELQKAAEDVTAADTESDEVVIGTTEDGIVIVAGEAGVVDGKDLSEEVINAAGKIPVYDVDGNLVGDEEGTSIKDDVDNAQDAIDESEKDLSDANDAIADAADDIKEESAAVDDAGKIADEVDAYVTETQEKADELITAIKEAETVDDANEAYDKLTDLAKEAEDKIKEETEKYNDAVDKFEQAEKKLKEAEEAYAKALKESEEKAAEALRNLEAAEEKVDKLGDAVDAAISNIEATNKAAFKIIDAQNAAAATDCTPTTMNNEQWRLLDSLMISIMENYYVPQILDTDAKDIKVTRIQGKDNGDMNYFTVTYKDATGKKQTAYYNYKRDGVTTTDIFIFEKRAVEVGADKYLKDNKLPNQKVYTYETKNADGSVKTNYIAESELKDNSSIVTVSVNGKEEKWVKNGDGTPLYKITESIKVVDEDNWKDVVTADGVTSTKIDNTSSAYVIRDGKLVDVTNGDVTTDTYTRETTDEAEYKKGGYTEEEKNAAVAALGDKVEFSEVVDKESGETYYVVTGKYVPVWTADGINYVTREKSHKFNGEKVGSANAIKTVENKIKEQGYNKIENYKKLHA